MLLPQLAVLVVEYVGLRLTFRRELAEPAGPDEEGVGAPLPGSPSGSWPPRSPGSRSRRRWA